MCGSINGFFHDKLTELNVFPWPHPFTPGATGKITKQRKRGSKEGLGSRRKSDQWEEEKHSPCNLARPPTAHIPLPLPVHVLELGAPFAHSGRGKGLLWPEPNPLTN